VITHPLKYGINCCEENKTRFIYQYYFYQSRFFPSTPISAYVIFLLLFFLIFTPLNITAQYYSSGQEPASVRWRQINTENFKLVFPDGYEASATYIANTLEYAAKLDTVSFSVRPGKIPVLIHNFTSISNGMVAWAPKRMELYTIPPQNTYGQEWFQQLAIHEYRHVIQLSQMKQGLTRILTYLFGEQIAAGVLGLYIPFWFLEGDAVLAETMFSQSGRGRLPSFSLPLRTQLTQKGAFSYDKSVFGSFRDFVPDHYVLGYHLVTKAREKYGVDIWNHVLDKVAKNPFMIVPFSEGIRDITELGKTKLYEEVMNELKQDWQNQLNKSILTPTDEIAIPEKDVFTNYLRPYFTDYKTIIAEKSPFDDITMFVEIDSTGNETKIYTPGYYLPQSLTYAGDVIAWAEREYDPRWQHRNYSVIKIYDRKTGKSQKITNKSRFFAPALSPDASRLVVVDVTLDQRYALVIIETTTGKEIQRVTTSQNYYFTNPSWCEDGKKIVTIIVGNQGKAIALVNPENGTVDRLTNFSYTDISNPVMYDEKIYFTGAWSGVDNIYQLDIDSKKITMVVSAPFGITDPQISADGTTLIFANYSEKGFKISQKKIDETQQVLFENFEYKGVELHDKLFLNNTNIFDPEKIPEDTYPIKNYSKILNLFNFHSWGPLITDYQNSEFKPGISMLSQNLLSSSVTVLGWEYNTNEQTGKYYFNFRYEGLYPAFGADLSYGKRKSVYTDTTGSKDYYWRETNLKSDISVPLRFVAGKYTSYLTPIIAFDYTQLDIDPESGLRFDRANFKTLTYRVYAAHYLKMSSHDLAPKWGQWVGVNYRSEPFKKGGLGSLLSGELRCYFPGIKKHHSLSFYAANQNRNDSIYYYNNIIRLPRGRIDIYGTKLNTLTANYAFPLLYPDVSLSSFMYIKRLRMNLFYDHTTALANNKKSYYPSTGFEFFADVHLLRFLAPVAVGLRFNYLPDTGKTSSDFLVSINFDSL